METLLNCIQEKKELCKVISALKAIEDVNGYFENGKTSLHVAVESNQLDVCLLLLDSDANVNAKILESGDTPLHLSLNDAVDPAICHLLIEYGGNVNDTTTMEHTSPLHKVVDFAEHNPVQIPDSDVLQKYCDRYVKLDILLENDADTNILNRLEETPLQCLVAGTKHVLTMHCPKFEKLLAEMLRLLIKYEADINFKTVTNFFMTPLQYALMYNQHFLLGVLLENGANPHEILPCTGETLLHRVITFCNLEYLSISMNSLKMLLHYGLPINAQSSQGCSLLHSFLYSNVFSSECIRYLIELGINVNLQDICGRTAIFDLAKAIERDDECYANDPEPINIFIRAGTSINHRDYNGSTALIEAVSQRHPKFVSMLLEVGADINATDKCNRSCLHHLILSVSENLDFCSKTRVEILDLLLRYGIDVNLEDKFGKSAIEYINFVEESIEKILILQSPPFKNYNSTMDNILKSFTIAKHQISNYFSILRDDTDLISCDNDDIQNNDNAGIQLSENKLLELLHTKGIGMTCSMPSFQVIEQQVKELVTNISEQLAISVPYLKCEAILSGSVSEGTKVGLPNEFDYLLRIEGLEDMLEPCNDVIQLGYTCLKLKYPEQRGLLEAFLDGDDLFNGIKFFVFFQETMFKILGISSIWNNIELYSTFFIRNKIINENPANFLIDIVTPHATFGIIPITIDLVPVIQLPRNWKPTGFNENYLEREELLSPVFDSQTCCAALLKYKMDNVNLFRVSFSLFETPLIHSLSQLNKEAYMLIKMVLSMFTMSDDEEYKASYFISTYFIKTVLINACYGVVSQEESQHHVKKLSDEVSHVFQQEESKQHANKLSVEVSPHVFQQEESQQHVRTLSDEVSHVFQQEESKQHIRTLSDELSPHVFQQEESKQHVFQQVLAILKRFEMYSTREMLPSFFIPELNILSKASDCASIIKLLIYNFTTLNGHSSTGDIQQLYSDLLKHLHQQVLKEPQ